MRAGLSLAIGLAVLGLSASAAQARPTPSKKAYLGVSLVELTAMERRQPGLKRYRGYGVVIQSVLKGTPAAGAGFRPGDVIMRIKGKWVSTPKHVITVISRTAVGSRVTVEIMRNGKWLRAKILLTARPKAVRRVPVRPRVVRPKWPARRWPVPRPYARAATSVSKRLQALENEVRRLRKVIEELKVICKNR